ncbi:hypothetical protein [Mucilaginibacter sp. UR6-11]|uniref:hypothetical protein n=1 Tax=Mucilaginibacter sp. UR6-11 TaxID=1435644 RepID=UPI001E4BB896|nr:hypothetical protein [Mucilaginibacter sp. UR6-11]MCC8424420.1 hypothetical protein [Mucilaginibacter sp. UR6-11]
MKTRFLFPHKWRYAGLVLLFLGVLIRLLDSYCTDALISWQNTHPLIYGQNVAVFASDAAAASFIICFILGLMLFGFSKEKIEDEQIAQLRLDSLQWAVYINYAIFILCAVFVHGFSFISIIAYNTITPLIFFIIRFRWKIYSLNRELKNSLV